MTTSASRICLILSAMALAASPARASGVNVLTDAERANGWRLLFDGTSLAGWRGVDNAKPGAGWRVVDGAIVLMAKTGDLVTADDFGDFELSIEWEVADATNSGILYRVCLDDRQVFRSGPEYQILDNVLGGDRFEPKHTAGALYDLVAPPRDLTRPAGAWNQTRIVVRGWHVEHWLNGERIVDVDLASAEGRALIAHSKFAAMAHFASFSRGHVALQDHGGGRVSFRNIKIRDLPGTR
jgi:hypothetical protein